MANGSIEAVLHELEFAPKDRTGVGTGSGPADSVSHRFLRSLEGAILSQQTDSKGLPLRLEEILQARRDRVRVQNDALYGT
jgi:hypothetical protein